MAFRERLVNMAYGFSPVPMEFLRGCLELSPSLLQMTDGRLDAGMLGRGASRGGGDRRGGYTRMRRRGLGAKSEWQ